MPRLRRLVGRRLGPVGLALTAWDIWRHLPPHYRRQILELTKKHGPRVATAAAKGYRSTRRFKK